MIFQIIGNFIFSKKRGTIANRVICKLQGQGRDEAKNFVVQSSLEP
jgi:hypothetical protein